MAKNRMGTPDDEEQAIAHLATLARAQGAESRAADVVAARILLERFRFSPVLGWMEWDGRRWDTDDIAEPRVIETIRAFIDQTERDYRAAQVEAETVVAAIVNAIVRRLPDELKDAKPAARAKAINEEATPEELERWQVAAAAASEARRQADIWLNLLSAGKLTAITKLCRGMDGIVTRSSAFDAHPDWLNCRNGVVDLRTGELLPHDPALLLTHLAGGEYDPTATSALWDQALKSVHPDVREWFQIRMGQALTGHTPDDDSLLVCFGGGSNGKTAVLNAVQRACGSYGRLISHRVLIAQPGQHSTELTDLRGLRLAVLEETPEEGHLDTHQLKVTIGTPQITARKMRRDDVTFNTSHSLVINTNFLPQVDSTDHGTWRRLKAMPWPFKFVKPNADGTSTLKEKSDRAGDLTLKPKLAADETVPSVVLSWMVAGARRWYQGDRVSPQDPPMVAKATRDWRASTDIGFLFATEWLIKSPGHFITAPNMRAAFAYFLEQQGKRAWSAQTLNTRLPDSLAEAGILVDATPVGATTVRYGDKQSVPPSWATGEPTILGPIEVDKVVRMWRGVRFRTAKELGAEERPDHLQAVR